MDNEEEKNIEETTHEDDGQIQRSKPRKYKPVQQDKRKKGNMKPRTEAQKRATAKMLESRKAKIANKKQSTKKEEIMEEVVKEVEEEIGEERTVEPEVIKVKRTKAKAKPKPKPKVIYYESSESEGESSEPEIIVKKYNKVKDRNKEIPKTTNNQEQQPKKNMSRFLLMKGLGF